MRTLRGIVVLVLGTAMLSSCGKTTQQTRDTLVPVEDVSLQDAPVNQGAACSADSQCTGNAVCAVGPQGGICMATCPPECEEGLFCRESPLLEGGNLSVCTPRVFDLCRPCLHSDECGVEGDECVHLEGSGTFCGFACEKGDDCPSGTTCADVNLAGGFGFARQCVPMAKTCPCLPYHIGGATQCPLENDIGICAGTKTCQEGGTWSQCEGRVASEEVCNGIDDDCDGIFDDGFPDSDWDGKANCADDDDDNDKVLDDVDNCPSDANPDQLNSDDDPLGDGCDPDDDNDGWPDFYDCRPTDATSYPGAPEVEDGVDNDCNDVVDEPPGTVMGPCGLNCLETQAGPGTGTDFAPDDSNSDGVSLDEKGYLILGKGTLKFSNLWVSNSAENSVSRIDTQTGNEVGRYNVCTDPSRTAVDLEGNVWVGCRGDGGVVKILVDKPNCPDKDQDGTIETSMDTSGDGKIQPGEMLPKGQDECVKFLVYPGGMVQRGAAVDKDNFAWIGDWDGMKVRRLDPETGEVVQTIQLKTNPYGLAMDGNGILWVSGRGGDKLERADPATGETQVFAPVVPDYFSPYGISVDQKGRVWVADFSGTPRVFRYIPEEDKWDYALTASSPRGLAAAPDGNVYVALDSSDSVGIINGETMEVINVVNLGTGRFPVGMSIDMDGFIWAVNQNGQTATKIDPINFSIVGEYPVGMNPYCYSDMTGFQLLNYISPVGEYRMIVEGLEGYDIQWLKVAMQLSSPPGASTHIWVRAADTPGALGMVPYIGPFGPYPTEPLPLDLSGLASLKGRYLQVKVVMYISDAHQGPLLKSLKVQYKVTPP